MPTGDSVDREEQHRRPSATLASPARIALAKLELAVLSFLTTIFGDEHKGQGVRSHDVRSSVPMATRRLEFGSGRRAVFRMLALQLRSERQKGSHRRLHSQKLYWPECDASSRL
jgi:hypothetical protein